MSAQDSTDMDAADSILENIRGDTADGLREDRDGVAYHRKECSRWQKHDHDRLYFSNHDGYIDLETGGVEGETPITNVEVEDGRVVYYAEDIDHEYPVASREA